MHLLIKQKETQRLWEQIYGCREEGWEEGIVRAFGMDSVHTAIFKMDNQQGPTV